MRPAHQPSRTLPSAAHGVGWVLGWLVSSGWEVSRAEVVGNIPLPNIFPISVSLIYLVPASSERGAFEHLTGVKNVTLSAQ
jgi:hypothetical protein